MDEIMINLEALPVLDVAGGEQQSANTEHGAHNSPLKNMSIDPTRRPARPLALQNTGETRALGDGWPPASAATGVFQQAPKVSVIIPNYNHERYLSQRIESVLAQTVRDIEIIILDDASTDNSMSVIDRYATDTRVRVIPCAVNSGNPFIQWNRGVHEARGEYVWIAESDDYADPRLLETLVARLEARPTAVLAYCDSYRVNAEGVVVEVYKDYYRQIDPMHWTSDFQAVGRDEILNYLLRKNTIPNASAVLIRKSSYEKAGGAITELRLCGDWLMWIKMLLLGDLVYVSEPLNYFRCHGGNVRSSTGDFTLHKEHYIVLKYVVEHLGLDAKRLKRSLNWIAAGWACSLVEVRLSISRSVFCDVYRAARLIDPHPGMRLTKYLCLHYPWKIREIIR